MLPSPYGRGAGGEVGVWWAFRVWLSISWVLVGFSCFAEHFVGIGGLFVFGRGFSWVWVGFSCLAEAFRVWPRLFVFGRGFSWVWVGFSWVLMGISRFSEHFVGIGGLFVFGKQASPGNIMFDTPKHSAERVFW